MWTQYDAKRGGSGMMSKMWIQYDAKRGGSGMMSKMWIRYDAKRGECDQWACVTSVAIAGRYRPQLTTLEVGGDQCSAYLSGHPNQEI
jgi:hypothetical protein